MIKGRIYIVSVGTLLLLAYLEIALVNTSLPQDRGR